MCFTKFRTITKNKRIYHKWNIAQKKRFCNRFGTMEWKECPKFYKKLFNLAMKLERENVLKATPYQRTEGRTGYANGFKERHIQSRVGELALQIPQTRNVESYPSCLERGLRSERAINLAMAEMYIQGVATRSVRNILKYRCS